MKVPCSPVDEHLGCVQCEADVDTAASKHWDMDFHVDITFHFFSDDL